MRPINLSDIPYAPSQPRLDMDLTGKILADLGCGDGVALEALASTGATLRGYDLEPTLIEQAKLRVPQAELVVANFWDIDISDVDVVYLFWLVSLLPGFVEYHWPQLKKGSLVISYYFPIPELPLLEQRGEMYIYQK